MGGAALRRARHRVRGWPASVLQRLLPGEDEHLALRIAKCFRCQDLWQPQRRGGRFAPGQPADRDGSLYGQHGFADRASEADAV
jgi:hypothetical protein